MIINTEWPAFNSPDIKILAEDKEIDKASQCPGDHFFEKLTSPLYLGEVVRRILLRIAEEEAWPRADNLHSSTGCGDLSIEQLISATEDTSDTLSEGGQLMQAVCRVDAIHFSQQIRQEAKNISIQVLERSARLVAAASAGILKHKFETSTNLQNEPQIVVGLTGRLFGMSQTYRSSLKKALNEFSIVTHQRQKDFKLYEVIGGASFGAATLAAAMHALSQGS